MTKQPNLLLRITCNNCDAIIGENKEQYKPRQYSFGLVACCGGSPNSAFTLNVLDANKVTHLHRTAGGYHFVNAPDGMVRNTRLTDAYHHRLTYETIYNSGRAEVFVDHRRVGSVHLSWDGNDAYFHLNGVKVYLKDIDKEDDWVGGVL